MSETAVVIGSGFGGLAAAVRLRAPLQVGQDRRLLLQHHLAQRQLPFRRFLVSRRKL